MIVIIETKRLTALLELTIMSVTLDFTIKLNLRWK